MQGFEELVVLGTGSAMVTRCFNTCFALRKGGEYFLVDTGGGSGILAALDNARIDPAKIRCLFITHAHTDHILGFPWVVRRIATLMKSGGYEGDFTVCGHSEALSAAKTICALTVQSKFTALFDDRIIFSELSGGDDLSVLGERVGFFDIRSTKARQFGMTASAAGQKRLVFLGDEPCDKGCEEIARNADWLLCEAFCLFEDSGRFKPYEKHHGTVLDAARLAERLGVSNLVLWHTEDETLPQRGARYAAEAKSAFSGAVYVPEDLERIPL